MAKAQSSGPAANMQVVQYVGEGILKRKVVTEISQVDYEKIISDLTANLQEQFKSDFDKKMQEMYDLQGSLGERLTYSQQAIECFVWNNATTEKQATMSTPMLDSLITARGLGETKQDLVDAILSKVTEFSTSSANLLAEKLANDSSINLPPYIPGDRLLNMTFDVDGVTIDDVNQTTNETTNTVVMASSGEIDLSAISWLSGCSGVSEVAGTSITATYSKDIIDSNGHDMGTAVFSRTSPIVTFGGTLADGLPTTIQIRISTTSVQTSIRN